MRRFALILAVCFLSPSSIPAQSSRTAVDEWRFYGHDPGGQRYSPLKQINRKKVSKLKRAWTFHTGEVDPKTKSTYDDRVPAFECTPLVVDGVLYLSTPGQRVIALDSETGQLIWEFDSQSGRSGARELNQHRGVAYWEGPRRGLAEPDRRILFGTFDGRLIALDAVTGKLREDFGQGGIINLRAGVTDRWPDLQDQYQVTSPPTIFEDLVITGSSCPESPPKGPKCAVRAFDVRTAKLVWTFQTVPEPGEVGHETWEGDSWKDRTGANVWSVMSVDVERGMVFLPVGSAAYDFYGGDRKGQNLFANCVVALDARTGKLRWYFQTVHHDVWDYDVPAHPNLVTVRHSGRRIPAVAQVSKTGFVYLLDRISGRPLFPVEERPVPASPVPGEALWPTQPIPLKPPPLSRQSLSPEDLTDVAPESRRVCEETFKATLPKEAFTPYGLDLTVVFPGTLGGATWSGASFDPTTGYLYVNVNEVGAVGMMQPQPPGSLVPYKRTSPWGSYARFWDGENQVPCQKPPWGTLNAIDLNKGEIVWKVPLGVNDKLAARGIPPTGTPNLGGSIVTAGGLVFIAGSTDRRFRAFDARNGRILWETQLEAGGHATPLTYRGKRTGKQFVVVAAGGGGYFSTKVSDTLVAFSLDSR